MKPLSRILFCLLLLFPSAALAMDLASLQETAIQERAVVDRFETDVARSAEDITVAKGGYYPSVDLYYRANMHSAGGGSAENSAVGARINWNVFAGFRDRYQIASAEQRNEMRQLQFQALCQDLRLDVALGYLNVYHQLAQLTVAENTSKTLEKIYHDGQNRFAMGLIGKNEVLQFQVDYDNADIARKKAAAEVAKSVNNLSQTVGVPLRLEELLFTEFKEIPGALDEEDFVARMLAERSELHAAKAAIAASTSQIKVRAADNYPQLNVVGSYQNSDDRFFNGTGDSNEDEWRLELSIDFNLYRGGTIKAKKTKAELEKRGLEYDLKELEDGYRKALANLFIDYRVNLANVAVVEHAIAQAEENLRITQLKYAEGLQRESELLDAIAKLSRARYNKVSVIRTVFSDYFQIMRMIDQV